MGSIQGLRGSRGGGHGNPLQYSCLENPMDRGVWPPSPQESMWSQEQDTTERLSTQAEGHKGVKTG